jgi:hypothetical protein
MTEKKGTMIILVTRVVVLSIECYRV